MHLLLSYGTGALTATFGVGGLVGLIVLILLILLVIAVARRV
jgi:hypothetical protein